MAISAGNKSLQLLLHKTDFDPLTIDESTGNTSLIRLCRQSNDVLLMQTLLTYIQQKLQHEEIFTAFVERKNLADLTAFDYCRSKSRHDMAVILQEFTKVSQQIYVVSVKSILDDYRLRDFNSAPEHQLITSL